MKGSFEIFGGFFSSLLIFKGLALLAIGIINIFVEAADSVLHLFFDLVFLSLILLPLIIILLIFLTLVITFSFSYPKNNNYKLWIGFGLAIIVAYSLRDFFLGRIDTFIWANVFIGILLIALGIAIGRFLTAKYTTNSPAQ